MDTVVTSVGTAIVTWIYEMLFGNNWLAQFLQSISLTLESLGNQFYNAAVNICSGFVLTDPTSTYPAAWLYVKNLAQSDVAKGVANDLFIVFFLISLVNYALSVRSKVDLEDLGKIVARLFVGKFLVANCVTLIDGFWAVTAAIIDTISVSDITILASTPQLFEGANMLSAFVNFILGLVYAIVMFILASKLVTATWDRIVWVFLAVPFGAPAFATMVGTGQFSGTARAYIKYTVSIMVQFIAFAVLIRLVALLLTDFTVALTSGLLDAINYSASTALIEGLAAYFCNISFAALVATLIAKLDSKVDHMYGL